MQEVQGLSLTKLLKDLDSLVMDLEEVVHVKFLHGITYFWLFSGCITVYQ